MKLAYTNSAMTDISNSDDIIDSRDVLSRIDELEGEVLTSDDYEALGKVEDLDTTRTLDDLSDEELTTLNGADAPLSAEAEELIKLRKFVEEIRSNSGDSPEDGATCIRDSYFEDYAEELAGDIGAIDPKATWPLNCIDWTKAADELKADYSEIDFEGVEYWVRS